ncbi:MAG: YbaK/EbsC family protein [Bacteroidetes bacterium]|nr:YbaK/EbsC family protein [Bacteroidota bacterium]MCW5897061.1 YbaK/EbsC family protein [Bacteroidota bacterium]
MSATNELFRYLQNNGVEFRVHSHLPAFSAHDVALATHVPENQTAKALVVKAGMQSWLVVLRADYRIDQRKLRDALETHNIHLVPEEELDHLFPNCEIGAMPPFGNLYGMPVIVDKALANQKEIVFNACTHTESVRMRFEDFERLANPMIVEFAVHKNHIEEHVG